jgi:hypothetical protein
MAMCVSIETLQSNNDDYVRKTTMQRTNSYDKKKSHEYVKVRTLCSNITQQTGHFIAPDSDVGFIALY